MGPFGRIPGSELSGLRSHSSGSPPSCSHSSLPSKSDLQVWLVQRASTFAQVDNGSRPSSARRLRGCYVRRRPRSAATKDWFAAVHVRAWRCLKLSVRTLRRRSSATRGCSSACGGRRFNTEEENRHSGTDRCSRLPRQQLKAVLLLLLSACGARVSVSTKTLKSTTSPSLSLCLGGFEERGCGKGLTRVAESLSHQNIEQQLPASVLAAFFVRSSNSSALQVSTKTVLPRCRVPSSPYARISSLSDSTSVPIFAT